MTLNQLVYDTLELIKANQISDDVDIDARQLEFHWNTERALLLREMLKKGSKIDSQVEQDFGCLDVVEVDASDCCIDTECILLRTSVKLPPLIDTDGKIGLTRVGPIHKLDLPFSIVSYDQAQYSGEGKYTNNMAFVFILNGYLYIKTSNPQWELLGKINARGIVENPSDLQTFNMCNSDSPCFSKDDLYPINGWMIPIIRDRILKRLGITLQIPKDNSNDANDNATIRK